MADLSKTVSIIFESEDRASASIGKIEAAMKGIDGSASVAAGGLKQIENTADGLEKTSLSADSLAKTIKGLAIAAVVKEFVDANVAAEQFSLSMTATTGSTQKAGAEFEYIKSVAAKFGLELLSTAEAYAKFQASAKGTTIDTAEAKVIFEAIAGTMSRLGSSAADVSGALVQLSQGVGKNKFELEDLKSIADRIPGFFGAFAKSLGVTTEELYSMISAGKIGGDEILKFSQQLNTALAGVQFDGFVASANRFKNGISDAYLELGKAGAFDVLTRGVQLGTAAITGAISALKLLGEIAGNVAYSISSGDWSGFGDRLAASLNKAGDATKGSRDALLGYKDDVAKVADAGEAAGEKISTSFEKVILTGKDLEDATKKLNASLKELGIDPKTFVDPIEAVQKAFADLASNPAVTGDQFLSGFLVTLDKIKGSAALDDLRFQLEDAFQRGTIGSDKYGVAIEALSQKQSGVWDGMIRVTKETDKTSEALAKQAKEADKVAAAAEKMALELEKLASNERIKLIEARVTLNSKQLEADTKRIEATFESINNTVTSTGDVISSIFGSGLFKDSISGLDPRFKLAEQQIAAENRRRDEALVLQKEMTQAQIDEIRARTRSLENGDALIKIDGAGLKPHLEAFMWEILRAIQTRVNRDGLKLLTGV
jgi:tape measure domain-containing protein